MYYVAFFVIVLRICTPIFDAMPAYLWLIGGLALTAQFIKDQK